MIRFRHIVLLLPAVAAPLTHGQWRAADGPLMTRFAADVSPTNVHREYPRPQMMRKEWLNLNGLWDYAVRPKAEGRPKKFDGQILVPFPIESALSGVMKRVDENQRLWYRRTFTTPDTRILNPPRFLLHFGAVDWDTTVWINGVEIGSHRGGYDPFSFDISDALKAVGEQEIVIAVWDPTDAGTQPRGKQVRKPGGIWYTPTTGIWQTVWMEPVSSERIESLKIVPDVDRGIVHIEALTVGIDKPSEWRVSITVSDDGEVVATQTGLPGRPIEIQIPDAKLWSPEKPFLYDVEVTLALGDDLSRSVKSYFGMRKISLGKDESGVTRILLNNKPLFICGLLDQGFWPDGLYTAPTDEALRYDIEVTKQLGFNAARKHVKVEPDRWYYWADKLGLLVLQDMPSGDRYLKRGQRESMRGKKSAEQFEYELRNVIDALRNHPSIVMWVPFNEGWGQYDTVRIAEWVRTYDPTRLVDCASGWNDFPAGDVHDIHSYPGPASPEPEAKRAAMLGEFGGLGLPLKGHTWQDKKNWGYRSYDSREALTDAYVSLIANLHPLIGSPGLSAAIYTQTTDVEIEVNGLMTYDRAVIKMDPKRVAAANQSLYGPAPTVESIVPTAQKNGREWRYTIAKPAETWARPGFDDSSWKLGKAGFGTKGTPGAMVRTEWATPDIWLRREIEWPDKAATDGLHLRMHHDEDATVYINGVQAVRASGYTTGYLLFPITREAMAALKPGRNLIAVHCKQTGGGQYIDVGIVRVRPAP